ncbi:MAG: DUF302 domain-containing protein [Candidatus Acidiferrales bacterium]
MTTRQINVQRVSVISKKKFEDVVAAFDAALGHTEMGPFMKSIAAAKNYAEVEKIVAQVVPASDLMEFVRFDLGGIVRKQRGEGTPRSLRVLIGNPLTMKRMLEHVPDVGSYAPVTLLIDERPDGVHLTYDTMTSFLAPYGNAAASKVAQELDAKVDAVMKIAAH